MQLPLIRIFIENVPHYSIVVHNVYESHTYGVTDKLISKELQWCCIARIFSKAFGNLTIVFPGQRLLKGVHEWALSMLSFKEGMVKPLDHLLRISLDHRFTKWGKSMKWWKLKCKFQKMKSIISDSGSHVACVSVTLLGHIIKLKIF